jgi:Skp family chaperone for outer membrane proteins
VKRIPRWAITAVVVLSLGYMVSPAVAQPPQGPPGTGPRIALLDVNSIFKNHARFKGMMEDLRADMERAEAQVKSDREVIAKLAEKMQEFRKGTLNYQQREEDFTRRQADLQVKVQMTKNQILQQEAKIYHNVYQEIWQATDFFTRDRGIDIVLRFNGDPVDVDRPDSVLAFINKPVVWYQKNLDITPAILEELNRTSNPAAAQQPRNGAPPRQGVPFQR